jgi:Protein of unknown function (DUF1360).
MTFDSAFVIRFLLAAFAVYRLAYMITLEDGPFGVFESVRLWFGKTAANHEPQHGGRSLDWTMAELFNCPHCIGVWLAILCAPAVIWPSIVTDIILIILALAGLQSYLTGRGDE